ncbi:MAG: hypothetical protein R3E53_15295 [Myxococcota bacterium]
MQGRPGWPGPRPARRDLRYVDWIDDFARSWQHEYPEVDVSD